MLGKLGRSGRLEGLAGVQERAASRRAVVRRRPGSPRQAEGEEGQAGGGMETAGSQLGGRRRAEIEHRPAADGQ